MTTKTERAEIVLKDLQKLYPEPPIPLDHEDPFTLLIAVLLSAQCTDERVNLVTPGLFKLGKSPTKLKMASVKQIEEKIKSCGLAPRKAKAIHELCHILDDKFAGVVPKSMVDLETLPGVGHKTASVVMSQAFNVPAFAVDTHIHRLAQRWRLTSGKNVKQTEADLKKLFPKETWNKLHLQIIYYGREYCSARICFGLECPICKKCNPGRKSKIETKKA